MNAASTGRHWAERVVVSGAVIIVGLWLLTRLFGAVAIASSFGGEATDGTFQLLNPLRRIAVGQHVGTDFQFFHGPLVLLLHWPVFHLAPGLWSVELQRWLLPPWALILSMGLVWRAMLGGWSRTVVALAITSSAISGSMLGFLASPQQSELGLRAAMPVLMAAALARYDMRRARAAAMLGVLLAGSYLAGYEQGLAMAGTLLILGTVRLLATRESSTRRRIAGRGVVLAGSTVFTACALALVIARSLRGAVEILAWPFTVLAPFQNVTFGSPPSPTLLGWDQVAASPIPALLIGALAALAALWRRMRDNPPAPGAGSPDEAAAALVLQGTLALVSLAGTWTPNYYGAPLFRALWLVAWYLVVITMRARPSAPLHRFAGGALIAACLLTWPIRPTWRSEAVSAYGTLLAGGTSSVRTWWSHLSPSRMGLSPSWAQHVALADEALADEALAGADPPLSGAPPLWSTFTGLVEARHGWFAPDADYLIHVLGPARLARYVQSFRDTKPAVVQTARVTSFPFEPVMQVRWWPFYDALLSDYDLSAAGPFSLLWTRRLTGTRAIAGAPIGTWTVADDDQPFTVPCPASPAYLLEAAFAYEPALPLPMLSSLRRAVLWVSTPTRRRAVALGEDEQSVQIPVLGSRRDGPCRIWVQRAPFLPARRLMRLVVRLRPLDVDQRTARLLFDDAARQVIERASGVRNPPPTPAAPATCNPRRTPSCPDSSRSPHATIRPS